MFKYDKEKRLADNELFMESIIDIMNNSHATIFAKKDKKIEINVYSVEKEKNFCIYRDNKGIFHINKVNENKSDITVVANKNFGYIKNKDLNIESGYKYEEIDEEIKKITTLKKIDESKVFQSYLEKKFEAILIQHKEEIPIEEMLVEDNEDREAKKILEESNVREIGIYIKNNNLIDTSEEEMYEYLEEQEFGEGVDILDIENLNEEEYDEYKKQEYEDDEQEEEYDNEDNEEEDIIETSQYAETIEEYRQLYHNYEINGKNIQVNDELSKYEMIEDVETELQDDIYIDKENISLIKELYMKFSNLYKLPKMEKINEDNKKREEDNDLNR